MVVARPDIKYDLQYRHVALQNRNTHTQRHTRGAHVRVRSDTWPDKTHQVLRTARLFSLVRACRAPACSRRYGTGSRCICRRCRRRNNRRSGSHSGSGSSRSGIRNCSSEGGGLLRRRVEERMLEGVFRGDTPCWLIHKHFLYNAGWQCEISEPKKKKAKERDCITKQHSREKDRYAVTEQHHARTDSKSIPSGLSVGTTERREGGACHRGNVSL